MIIPYAKHEITTEDIESVTSALKSGYLTGGMKVDLFEENFKKYVGSKYAVAVSSGTAGLHLAVAALTGQQDKTVLLPSLTFAATANCVLYSGARIEFVDIDPKTLLMDFNVLEKKLKKNPDKYAGVIAVDFAGYPLDIKTLRKLCESYGVWLVEDAAHALGAVSTGNGELIKVGNGLYSDATVFSFHPAKHITTGEGGMITTNSEKLYKKLKLIRSHAMDRRGERSKREGWYYGIEDLGYNYRLSEINAALGVSQLNRAKSNLEKRRKIATKYNESFVGTNMVLPIDDDNIHAYHLYVIQSPKRQEKYYKLRDKGIFTQVHYVPLHTQLFYKNCDGLNELINTEKYYEQCLSIPIYPTLSYKEQAYVIDSIKSLP